MTGIIFLQQFKDRAEFIKSGSIIPQRILRGESKKKHKVVAGCDVWAIPTPKGYLIAADCRGGSVLKIKDGIKNLNLIGSPYTPGGLTHWIGNHNLSDEDWGNYLLKVYTMRMYNG